MTHNRAGEVSSPEGCWLPCRQAHRSGGCSAPLLPRLCITGQLFYQTWCSLDSQPRPQQEPHGTVPAYRPDPLPPSPGCQGPEVPHPFQLPWPGLDEHSLLLDFPLILLVVVIIPANRHLAAPSMPEGPSLIPSVLSLPLTSHFARLPPCRLLASSLACLSRLSFLFPPSLRQPPSELSLSRLQMENICSPELCNSPFYYFFLRHPDLTLHPVLGLVFLLFLPMPSPPACSPRDWGMDSLFLGYLLKLFAGGYAVRLVLS